MNSQRVKQTASMLICVFALSASTAAPRHDVRYPRNESDGPEALANIDEQLSVSSGAAKATAPKDERHPVPRRVDRVRSTQVIPAGTAWNSAVRSDENCDFDLKYLDLRRSRIHPYPDRGSLHESRDRVQVRGSSGLRHPARLRHEHRVPRWGLLFDSSAETRHRRT
jgi:hypothetical protein